MQEVEHVAAALGASWRTSQSRPLGVRSFCVLMYSIRSGSAVLLMIVVEAGEELDGRLPRESTSPKNTRSSSRDSMPRDGSCRGRRWRSSAGPGSTQRLAAAPDTLAVAEPLRLEVEQVQLAVGLAGRDELTLIPLRHVVVVGVLGRHRFDVLVWVMLRLPDRSDSQVSGTTIEAEVSWDSVRRTRGGAY